MSATKTVFYGRVNMGTGNSTTNKIDGSGASAPWSIKGLPEDKSRHFISVTVYAEGDTLIPIGAALTGNQKLTAGTVVITGSPDGVNFGGIENGTIELSKADFKLPNLCGPLQELKVDIKGINPSVYIQEGVIHTHGVTVRIEILSYE